MRSGKGAAAIVTGTNRGTGHAIAEHLHERGYRVVGLVRRRSRGNPPSRWEEIECDLRDPTRLSGAVQEAVAGLGRLDLCVCNAVTRSLGSVSTLPPAAWDEAVAVNLTSVFRLIQLTLPAVRAAEGRYVVMGSHAGSHFFEGGAAYSATKAALKGLVETLLLEERPHGVTATLVSAGAIANLEGDIDEYKMSCRSIARLVVAVAVDHPSDLMVGEIEVRPSRLQSFPLVGLERLQHV